MKSTKLVIFCPYKKSLKILGFWSLFKRKKYKIITCQILRNYGLPKSVLFQPFLLVSFLLCCFDRLLVEIVEYHYLLRFLSLYPRLRSLLHSTQPVPKSLAKFTYNPRFIWATLFKNDYERTNALWNQGIVIQITVIVLLQFKQTESEQCGCSLHSR